MFLRCFVLICIASYVVTESIYDPNENDQPFNELPCTVIGGKCQEMGKCPQGTRVTTNGLCPYQEHRGIQCCHSSKARPVANPTCRSRGGECMEAAVSCPKMLTVRGVTDCKSDETCCVLVR